MAYTAWHVCDHHYDIGDHEYGYIVCSLDFTSEAAEQLGDDAMQAMADKLARKADRVMSESADVNPDYDIVERDGVKFQNVGPDESLYIRIE